MSPDTEQVKQLKSLITEDMQTIHSLSDPSFVQIQHELNDMHSIVRYRMQQINHE